MLISSFDGLDFEGTNALCQISPVSPKNVSLTMFSSKLGICFAQSCSFCITLFTYALLYKVAI